jgi:tRNA A-37 threonylcarbamoyl transferase component Bud32
VSNPETAPHPLIDNRYRVTRVLGEGGMGIVYEAQHVGTKRPFAVKLIHASIARRGQAMERFLREGEAAGTIRSPHVVDVNDVGIDRATGSAFMAMELLSGDELGRLIEERGRLSPQLALRIVAQALQGLAAAHRAGVVHRDIKPSNLWLARKPDNPLASGANWVEGQRVLKVLDFGIAKLRAGDDGPEAKRNLTRTGGLVGSPSYMSPEQSGGLPDIDHRTDIWSLGAVMYEALTGTTPYQGAANLNQLMLQIALGPPELITRRDPSVPADVAAIVTKALAHNPADRYQSAEEMLSDVRRAIVGPEPITEEMLPVSIAAMVAPGPVPVGVAPSTPSGGGGAAVGSASAPAVRSVPAVGVPKGDTQVLPPGAHPMIAAGPPLQTATQAGLGRTVEPGQTRRLAVLAAVIIGATVLVALFVVSLFPRRRPEVQTAASIPAEEAGGGIVPSSASGSAGAVPASSAPASEPGGSEPGAPGPGNADAGQADAGLPDAGAPDGGRAQPPAKGPATPPAAPGDKSKSSFGQKRSL